MLTYQRPAARSAAWASVKVAEPWAGLAGLFPIMMATPADPDGPLWAGRVKIGSEAWLVAGGFEVEALPAHRRVYLTFEGELSGGNGAPAAVRFVFLHASESSFDARLQSVR